MAKEHEMNVQRLQSKEITKLIKAFIMGNLIDIHDVVVYENIDYWTMGFKYKKDTFTLILNNGKIVFSEALNLPLEQFEGWVKNKREKFQKVTELVTPISNYFNSPSFLLNISAVRLNN